MNTAFSLEASSANDISEESRVCIVSLEAHRAPASLNRHVAVKAIATIVGKLAQVIQQAGHTRHGGMQMQRADAPIKAV